MGIFERHTPCHFTLKEEKKQVTDRKEKWSSTVGLLDSVDSKLYRWAMNVTCYTKHSSTHSTH